MFRYFGYSTEQRRSKSASLLLFSPEMWGGAKNGYLHVKCVPGLEKLVCEELRALRISSIYNHGTGLVVGKRVNTRQVYLAHTMLRTASRILVPACTFPARSFAELEKAVVRLRDEHLAPFLADDVKMNLRVKSAPNSPLFHTKVRGACEPATGERCVMAVSVCMHKCL